ncbi:MAG: DUF4493 domain-containing protein [Bacteroides sp.]|nr:DUF4493 domain-containing protein [Bacteroides sp.]
MKLLNIATFGTLAMMLLAGCELKNELLGDDSSNQESGALELGVTVKQPTSLTRADVSTDNFPVTIQGTSTDVADVLKEYTAVSEMPSSITLPVGTYTVSSHTPGDIEKQMTEAYYSGSTSMTITKDITTETTVTCRMKNSRIQVTYGEDFLSNFSSWTITVDDGSSSVYTCETSTSDPDPVYWYFEEGSVTAITVNIRAVTSAGNSVSESRTFYKSNAAEAYDDVNDYFEGGDAIVVKMGATQSSSGNITGITINTSITFEDHDESIEIPTGDPITITDTNGYATNGISITESTYPTDVTLTVAATDGIANFYVLLTSDNTDLTTAASSMGLTTGDGADLTSSSVQTALSSLFTSMPAVGDKEYTFTLGTAIMTMLQSYTGTHYFTLKVVDANANTLSQLLTVTVTKKEEESNTPTLTFESGADKVTYISENEISYSMADSPSGFDAYITAPQGIESIVVTIAGGNAAFDAIIQDLKMDGQSFLTSGSGVNIVGNADFTSLLATQSLTGPTKGDTSYTFPIGVFFTFLNMTGATDEGSAHQFNIVITDQAGNSASGSLKIHITE